MALKDIRTNLENYKFGMSEPVRIDAQIENGVDFFDDLEGGVTRGFTTKVVPGEHQTEYLKFYEGTPVGPRSHSGTYYADLNPIESRSSIYRDSSGNYVLPDTGVNTNPPGTQSGILKFTPPQTTLSLEDGFPNPLLNYIDDAVKGTVLAMEKGLNGEIYHIRTQEEISIRELVKYTGKLMGFQGEYIDAPTYPGSVESRCPDIYLRMADR